MQQTLKELNSPINNYTENYVIKQTNSCMLTHVNIPFLQIASQPDILYRNTGLTHNTH